MGWTSVMVAWSSLCLRLWLAGARLYTDGLWTNINAANIWAGGWPPQRIFLSHTSDLREYPPDGSFVAAAEAAVMRSGHAVTDMAYFAARDTRPAEYCIAKVTEAHVYVGIIGSRYGAPVRGRPDLSYTELEFETATRLQLPRLVFLLKENALPRSTIEPSEFVARQDVFRRRLLEEAGLTVAWVTSPADLQIGLHQSLVELASMA